MSDDSTNISRTIFRAAKWLGGAQVMSNLCSIILNKLVALWIGPIGMGLFSIYNATIDMLRSATSLGLRQSSVRDIALADESHDDRQLARMVAVVRRWAWFISLFGAITTMALAPLLSRWSFGDSSHLWHFVALSAALLLLGFTHCELSILQGTERIKRLAWASLSGTVIGLLLSIPLFYFFREDSILLSVIAYHVALFGSAWFFRHKGVAKAKVSNKEAIREGATFVRLGLFMTLSEFVTMLSTYIFSAYLNRTAGTEIVGFYQSGYSLIGRYVALILTALGTEFYPRLSKVCTSHLRTRVFVAQEINIIMLCMLPFVSLFLLCRECIVWLLYTSEFHVIIPYISWAIVGCVLRAFSWFMAYTIIAKGDGKTYLFTESLSVVIGFLLNVICYNVWGLEGLGIAFMLWYAFYCLIIAIVYSIIYKYTLPIPTLILSLSVFCLMLGLKQMLDFGLIIPSIIVTLLLTAASITRLRKILRHK